MPSFITGTIQMMAVENSWFCVLFLKNVELASYHPSSCLILLFIDTAVNSNLIYL